MDAVDAGRARAPQGPHHFARFAHDLDPGRAFRHRGAFRHGRALAQPVVDRRAVLRVPSLGGIAVRNRRRRDWTEAVGVAWREEVGRGGRHVAGGLLQGRQVVQNPEAASVGADHQVVEALLHHDPGHGRGGQVLLQRLPAVPRVERDVDCVLGAGVEHPGPLRVLHHDLGVAQHAGRNAVGDLVPGFAVVAGSVQVRVADVHLVAVGGDVGGRRVVAGRGDAAHGNPLGQPRHVGRHVGPGVAPVSGDMHEPVVGARPDQPRLDRRLADAEDGARVLHADVVAGQSAREAHPALVVQGQVGADHLPALPAVPRAVHVLAAHVDGVVVVGRNVNRRIPDEAVAHARRRAPALLRPHLHGPVLAPVLLVAHHDAAHHPRSRSRRPHNVRIGRVRRGPAAFAAAHVVPHPPGNAGDPALPHDAAVARPPVRGLVLLVAQHVVGDRVVHRHVVHLRVGESLAEPRLAAVDRDRQALVVGDDHAVGAGRVDPHVVMVAAGRLGPGHHVQRPSAVGRDGEGSGQEVRLVLVGGRHHHSRVVVRPAHGVAVARDQRPRAPAVLGAPELAVLRLASVPGNAVAGFEQCVDATRVRRRHRHRHLPHRLLGQADAVARPRQLLPRVPAVPRDVQAAARSAAGAPPGVNLQLPRAREEHAGVGRVHGNVGAARVLVHEQDLLPGGAAVGGAEDAALRLRPVGVAQRTRERDVRVRGVHDKPRNPPRLLQPHERPRPPCVHGLVDALADRDVAADLALAGARPDHVGVRRGHRQRTDRLDRLAVEDRVPVHAPVGRLVDAARRRAHVVGVWVARDARRRAEAVPLGADVAPFEGGVVGWGGGLLGLGGEGGGADGQREEGRGGQEDGEAAEDVGGAGGERGGAGRRGVHGGSHVWPAWSMGRNRSGRLSTACDG